MCGDALQEEFCGGFPNLNGGVWVMFIPGVISNLPLYILAILLGMVVTAGILFVLKRPVAAESEEEVAAAVAAAA